MDKTFLAALAAALLTTPFALAHDLGVGAPKPYCETAAQTRLHEYAGVQPVNESPATLRAATADGSPPACGGTWQDGHAEFAVGGAVLQAGEPVIGGCSDEAPHHPAFAPISVQDATGLPVTFVVANDWSMDIAFPCGDLLVDESMTCVGSCTPTFGPGSDGTYLVFVLDGTTGHVSS